MATNNRGRVLWFLLLISGWLIACGDSDGDQEQQRGRGMRPAGGMFQTAAIPVQVDTVKIEPISSYILTNATLEAQRQVDVIARVSGIVQRFYVEEGDVVRKGQILVKLDDSELRLEMERARAQMENARSVYERSKEMFEKNLISKEQYDNARYQYETARAQYESAKLQLEYATIRAPVSGVITSRMVEIGDYVTANRVLYTMADYDTLLARIYVPEKDIVKIRPGQRARIQVEAYPDREFTGRVKMISPVVDPASGTVKVTVEIVRRNQPLLPGMFATVYIVTETHPRAMVIPKKALILESETDRVFVYENGVARLRDIKTGFTDGERLEVLEGLEPGELVITVGQEGLRDGSAVRIAGATELRVAAGETAKTGQPARKRPGEQAGRSGKMENRSPGGTEGMSPEILARIEKRMLQNPDIRREFEKRAKEDPDFRNNPKKKMAFFREMRQKFGRQGPPH